jgi:lactoylglutathione lyase
MISNFKGGSGGLGETRSLGHRSGQANKEEQKKYQENEDEIFVSFRSCQFRNGAVMRVEKVKYVLWAADWQRCLEFYRTLFGGEISFAMEVWSEIVIAGATIGVHGGGEGKRTWTGLSFQVDDLRAAITQLKACGGALTAEPNDTEEDPLHLAMCVDTEGNEFMMTKKRR